MESAAIARPVYRSSLTMWAVGALSIALAVFVAREGFSRVLNAWLNQPEYSHGINEALVTTMWGLLIAIPAFIFVQVFRRLPVSRAEG